MKNFVHVVMHEDRVGIKTKAESIREMKLSEALNLAEDWLKYAPGAWVLVSDEAPMVWRDRFMKVGGERAFILVLKMDLQAMHGFLPGSMWNWFKGHGVETNLPE